MELSDDKFCFVCGPENPAGLKLRFAVNEDERSIATAFIPSKYLQGYAGIVHGGIISAVLDEAMTKLAYSLGYNVVTAKLTVRFKTPLLVGAKVRVKGRLLEVSGKTIAAEAVATLEDKTVIAESEGILMLMK